MKNIVALFISILYVSLCFAEEKPHIDRITTYLDGVITSKLRSDRIAGATLSLVSKDGILVSKGYGYADWENKILVNPDSTLFRIGSISKLFVWLAVMQQVELGNLDLDVDVNQYLTRFSIPDRFNEPITLRHLLSHTPGLDDRLLGLFSNDSTSISSLGEILANEMTQRVAPPGRFASYSNHGAALAAHIVELVSGMEWNEYVESLLFGPLGLERTTFRQPLPKHLRGHMSKGYIHKDGGMKEKPFEYIPLAPAGSVSASATDMARFMVALLNGGVLNDSVIVDTSSINTMLTPYLYHAPGVNPVLHGFLDVSHRGVRVIGHGGNTFWFHSVLILLPEHDFGLFLSYNSQGGQEAILETAKLLVENVFSDMNDSTQVVELDLEYLTLLAGEYRMSRYPQSDFTKLLNLAMRIDVSVKDGLLKTKMGPMVSLWEPKDSLTFRQVDGPDVLAFRKDESGNITHAFLSLMPIIVFERVSFLQSKVLHLTIIGLVVFLSLVVLVHWPMVYFVRRRYQPMSLTKRELPFQAKLTAWINAFLLLSFYTTFVMALGDAESLVFDPSYTAIKLTLIIPFVIILLTLLMLFYTITIWPMHRARVRSRLFYTLLLVANIAALVQLFWLNLIGFYM